MSKNFLWHECCVGDRYIVQYRAGKGKAGATVYGVRDSQDPLGTSLALKWPLRPEEWQALCALRDEATGEPVGVGIPRFLDSGTFWDRTYAVMELLGKPLLDTFNRLGGSVELKWQALRPLGRLLLRRLEAVHRHGLVHCDVQPCNIMFGRSDSDEDPHGLQTLPFLIDFGSAQRYPGGPPKRPDFGTVDFSSIRSAEECARGPLDDLESLGWVLCRGLFVQLPWFNVTKVAQWQNGRLLDQERDTVCHAVAKGKMALLGETTTRNAQSLQIAAEMPAELRSYLELCRSEALAVASEGSGFPNYAAFAQALGSTSRLEAGAAERQDLAEFRQALPQALDPEDRQAPLQGQAGGYSDPDDDEGWSPTDPEGTWVLQGLSVQMTSVIFISRQLGADDYFYEQQMAGGKMLSGDLKALPEASDGASVWSWEVELGARGRLRLRREGGRMISSFQKSGSGTWCKQRSAERLRQSPVAVACG